MAIYIPFYGCYFESVVKYYVLFLFIFVVRIIFVFNIANFILYNTGTL